MPEPRAAVMILVEASWADQTGALQAVPAWMENKSAGGACIRTKTRIGVGSKLSIQGRWEQISGTARYCRSVGNSYLVGIQRDASENLMRDRPISTHAPIREGARSSLAPVLAARVQGQSAVQEGNAGETLVPEAKVESLPVAAVSVAPAIAPPEVDDKTEVDDKIDSRDQPRTSQPQDAVAIRSTELETLRPPKAKEIARERKPMQHKWSELIHRHNKQDEVAGIGNGHTNGKTKEELQENPLTEGVADFHVDLLAVQDIYRTAGIVNLGRGYSISKVVEMVHSEHARGLSKEAKRAAVLIALDAAGVPVEEVLQDAKARRGALDSYEAEVRKEVEAEWAQKAEENVQIQAELERVKAHYMARIGRNQEGVAREKAVFNNWLTMKQQESQSISEAAELCVKSNVSEPAVGSLPAVSTAAAGAKQM